MAEHSTSYDATPYESKPFPQSHPDRLAVIATLFGMTPAPPSRCRVLELGCASGGNLIPMAESLPGSRFVGIELSSVQVAAAQAALQAVPLGNIEILQRNVMDVDESLGEFDYIIAHGLYSWVPDPVQDKILSICRERLAPSGVAYVSYNTLPGWHFRGIIRDTMLFHTEGLEDPTEKALQARAWLELLSQSVSPLSGAFGQLLASEAANVRREADADLLHDQLENVNAPVYFRDFVKRVEQRDLQYLGEAEFFVMLTSNLPSAIAQMLNSIAHDIIRIEQYIDFVTNRAFRQTLLCHRGLLLARRLDALDLVPFHLRSSATAHVIDLATSSSTSFKSASGAALTVAHPGTKAAFRVLAERYPQFMDFDTLLHDANQLVAEAWHIERETLAQDLLNAYAIGMVDLRLEAPTMTSQVTTHPQASRYARYQSTHLPWVTSQLHEITLVDATCRRVLQLLDGHHSVDDITQLLRADVAVGTLPSGADQELRAILARLGRLALLVR